VVGPANDSVGTEGSSLLEAALRGNPRHELTAVRALPSEIGRGDDLRSTLVASAAGSGSRWRRRDPPAAYRRGSEMICAAAGSRGRRDGRVAGASSPGTSARERTGRPRVVPGRAARTRMTVGYA
jgi:hypothetical protein